MKFTYEQERTLVERFMTKCGMPQEDAVLLGKVIAHSDFTGVYSHGLSRVTRYIKQFGCGALNPNAEFKTVLDDKACLVFDCDNGSGIVSVNKAYDATLLKAKEYGIAVGTGRRNANIGCGSYYGWRAAADDMICILVCTTYQYTAPYGGADKLLGTNPVVVAVPSGENYPMILDISTTNAAFGKIQAYQREGKTMPEGWANDIDGHPTTDPAKAYSLIPISGHKGSGMSIMIDMLSSMLSSACYGHDVGLFSKLEPENTGFCLILIDPARFLPLDLFKAHVDDYIRTMKESRKAAGVEEIYMPGEIEQKLFEKNKETGIEISDALEKELAELGLSLGLLEEGESLSKLCE